MSFRTFKVKDSRKILDSSLVWTDPESILLARLEFGLDQILYGQDRI